MDIDTLRTQLSDTEGQLSAYDANLPSEIKTQIEKAYTPALERSLGTTSKMMGDYLGKYFDTTSMGPGMAGSTAKDLAPTQKLGVMGRELGTMAGNLGATQQFSDYLGGQMTDMYGNAVQSAQLGQQNLADKYNRTLQLYQLAQQEAQAEKDRALQRSLAAQANAQFNTGDYLTNQETPEVNQDMVINQIQTAANALASQRKGNNAMYRLNGQNVGNINDAHNYLLNAAKAYNVRINPEWLWQQMGNTMKPITGIGGQEMKGAYYTPTY